MECRRLDKSLTVSGAKPPVKQCLETRAGGGVEPELVKYMSKLPVFLERAETTTPQENTLLSVGVLHWSRLEKWQHTHNNRMMTSRIPSTGASLLPLTDESSSGPSNVHKRTTSVAPRKHRQSDLMPHPGEQIKATRRKKPKDHRGFSVPDEQLGLNTDGCEKKKGLKGEICPKTSNGLNPEVGVNMEVISKADISTRKKSEKKLRQRIRNGPDGEVGQKQQGETKLYHSTKKLSPEETNTRNTSSTKKVQVVHSVEVQHSCPLPCKADGCSEKSKLSQCVPLSTKESNASSRGKLSEDRASSLLSVKHCTDEPSQRQDSKSHTKVSEKERSTSPFQRLSFSMGKASKTNSAGSTTKLDSMENSSKTVSSVSEKDTTTTSHLRRFLEPLLKPRATHSGNSVEGPGGQGVPRIKLGITGCRSVNVNDSAHEKKIGSSMVRAVLQVTVKNNQPLFRFAVNKETDIIAATQKKMGSSEEGECISVYTFFSIKDHKRNSSWLNQRGRGQTHGIISNVVAQMRVSTSLPSGSIREFVLFSVELDQESTEKSDLQLKNELAAIIVKMPRWFSTVQDHNAFDKEVKGHVKDRVFEHDISATVILQSGVHSMPHKGGPSSLIQRWRTGGSCDCGGWDMGCNLRILTNQHTFSSKSSTPSNSPPSSNPFELFFLGEQAEEHPFLSYKPIKEGIYSVAYDSSLSQLQAFSICMALAESRKMSEITLEHKSSCDQHKAREETLLVPGPRFKA